MSSIKISVIMPVYNGEDTVKDSIDSVFNQTFEDFEFIIVNDGSTDNTGKIIKEYMAKDNRIVLIEQNNLGLTRSLNIAIEKANGEYIARQDSDDVSSPDRLKYQSEFLDRYNEIGFLGCSYGLIDEKGRLFDFGCVENNPAKITEVLKRNNLFCHGSVLFRRMVLEKSGGYREFFRYAQDYDLYLRLIEFTLPGSVNKVLYYRRVLLDSISIRKSRLQSVYAELAKRCLQERQVKRDDNLILNSIFLDRLAANTDSDDLSFIFLESLYCIKNNDTIRGRLTIRPYLFPLSLKKSKFYFLWFFSYLPFYLRDIMFSLKVSIRRMRLLIERCS